LRSLTAQVFEYPETERRLFTEVHVSLSLRYARYRVQGFLVYVEMA
jgi:hypothetical protein